MLERTLVMLVLCGSAAAGFLDGTEGLGSSHVYCSHKGKPISPACTSVVVHLIQVVSLTRRPMPASVDEDTLLPSTDQPPFRLSPAQSAIFS